MSSRYDNRVVLRNRNRLYRYLMKERGVSFIRQYNTPRMSYFTPAQIATFQSLQHVWRVGDRYYKLAHTFYGDSKYWWVIAWYNKAPTEAHLRPGDTIYVPVPLEKVLRYYSG